MSETNNFPGSAAGRLLISLATYNEAGNLEELIHEIRLHAPQAWILVTDDNSPDGTGQIADRLKNSLPRIAVIHRSGKLGLGTALIAAMGYAIENDFEYFLNLDADFSHPPRYISDLLAGMTDHDVMIGSRYVPGGGIAGNQFDLKRKFMSTGINLYSRLFLGLPSKDNSGSYRCYRVSKLKEINFQAIRSRGYSFMQEILFWCRQAGCRIGETPIIFENRRAGTTKINRQEATRALSIIFQLGMLRLFGKAGGPSRQSLVPAPVSTKLNARLAVDPKPSSVPQRNLRS